MASSSSRTVMIEVLFSNPDGTTAVYHLDSPHDVVCYLKAKGCDPECFGKRFAYIPAEQPTFYAEVRRLWQTHADPWRPEDCDVLCNTGATR